MTRTTKNSAPPWSVPISVKPIPTAAFLAHRAACLLTPAERTAIARRPRFYSMPWLILAEQNTDFLP